MSDAARARRLEAEVAEIERTLAGRSVPARDLACEQAALLRDAAEIARRLDAAERMERPVVLETLEEPCQACWRDGRATGRTPLGYRCFRCGGTGIARVTTERRIPVVLAGEA